MMAVSCSGLLKLSGVRLGLLALFITVNIALYYQSKHAIMETFFRYTSSNRSAKPAQTVSRDSYKQFNMISDMKMRNKTDKLQESSADYQQYMKLVSEKVFLTESIVNPHDFKYLIKPNVTCLNRVIELMICVVISADNHEGRSVIRETWGTYANDKENNAALIFFIGQDHKSSNELPKFGKQSKIREESLVHGDILQEDYIDSYQNLSLKSVSILKWVSTFCSNTKFVLKVDDDMYVNIPFLVKVLRDRASMELTPSAFVIGSMQIDARPIRSPSSKWYAPQSLFSEDTYPKYVSGTAYAMTSEAAFLLYHASLRVPPFYLEDIYITGLCSRKAAVQIYDSGYFSFGKPESSGCTFKEHVSGHRYTHEEILKIHKELYDPNLKCW